jgi:acyl carrier protein
MYSLNLSKKEQWILDMEVNKTKEYTEDEVQEGVVQELIDSFYMKESDIGKDIYCGEDIFKKYEFDSLDETDFVLSIEQRFGILIEEKDIEEVRTFSGMHRYIVNRLVEQNRMKKNK